MSAQFYNIKGSSISFLIDNKLTIVSTFKIVVFFTQELLVSIDNPVNELLRYLLYN